MARKIRLTLFARLVLVMLVLIPAAWIGAAYLNDEDPVESLRRWMGWGEPAVVMEEEPTAPAARAPLSAPPADIDSLLQVNQALRQTIDQLQAELHYQTRLASELRQEVDSLKKRIWELENQ